MAERPPIHNSRRSPNTEEEAYEHGKATNRPRPPTERSKSSNAPFPHLYACIQPAFHTRFTQQTNSTPSVRKGTQSENTRVQPPQVVPTFHLVNIESAHLDACVCVRAWFKSGEVQKRQ